MNFINLTPPDNGTPITLSKGSLNVPNTPIIPFIEGDGTGPDIWKSAQSVLDKAVEKAYDGEKKIAWMEVYAGQKAYDKFGDWLPEDTIKAFEHYLVSIKGPLTTPIGKGFRSLNVTIRQMLDLYVCLRPVRYFNGVPSPVKHPQYVDMTIFRENTEDIYAGMEFEQGSKELKDVLNYLNTKHPQTYSKIRFPETTAIGFKPVSKEGSSRLVASSIQYAIDNKKPSVTLVHKGNIMKFTEGAFCTWGYDVAETQFKDKVFTWRQYDEIKDSKGIEAANATQEAKLAAGKILIKDVIADICLQQVLTRPREFSVIATLNLNGDYLSDALAAQVGGIGIAPGGNINYRTGHAVFEATHGTAPKYAGLDKVNPGSVILSGEMMLRHLGWNEAADLILEGIEKAINSRHVTYDFARLMKTETDGAPVTELKCSEFGNKISSFFKN